jgi:hypothetical protein
MTYDVPTSSTKFSPFRPEYVFCFHIFGICSLPTATQTVGEITISYIMFSLIIFCLGFGLL